MIEDEDEFFKLLDDTSIESQPSEDQRLTEYERRVKCEAALLRKSVKDELTLDCCCGDVRDLTKLSTDMFDDKELNKENISDFLDCFKSKFYTEVYKVDTGHSYVIDSIDLYPFGEYNYVENKLYQIDWSKGAHQVDGKVHLTWKETPVKDFKEFKHVLELDRHIESIMLSRDSEIEAFGPWTPEKLEAHDKWEEGFVKYCCQAEMGEVSEELKLEFQDFRTYLDLHPKYRKLFIIDDSKDRPEYTKLRNSPEFKKLIHNEE